MNNYEKPMAKAINSKTEGVYMASGNADKEGTESTGSTVKIKCRFGRTEASAGSDTCQACSKSGGTSNKLSSGSFREDYKGCIDNMPEKKE